MTVISIAEATQPLSSLIKLAAEGERIEIGAYGRSPVSLVPSAVREGDVELGLLAGILTVPTDFDAPLPDANLDEFDGGNA